MTLSDIVNVLVDCESIYMQKSFFLIHIGYLFIYKINFPTKRVYGGHGTWITYFRSTLDI
jgi:hypothetical protein